MSCVVGVCSQNSFALVNQLSHFDDWLMASQDLTGTYNFYKMQLQTIQWLRAVRAQALNGGEPVAAPPKRWLLKYPGHSAHIDQLIRIFPDVKLVHTQRNLREVPPAVVFSLSIFSTRCISDAYPALCLLTRVVFGLVVPQVVPSMCSLLFHLLALCQGPSDPAVHGRRTLKWLSHIYRLAAIKSRAAPAAQRIEIAYRDTVSDPIATVQRIFTHFGLSCDPALLQRMRQYMDSNRQGKKGAHTYSAKQFGLTDADIDAVTTRFN
jgi:hypothetical protein